MDQSAFYGIMSGIKLHAARSVVNAIKGRDGLGGPDSASGRMAYLVSLQFVIPATVSLLAQVAPDIPEVWRGTFAFAGLFGAIGIGLLAYEMRRATEARVLPVVLAAVGIPCYALALVVALKPSLVGSAGLALSPLEVEALLLSILVFLGVQEAWVVAMTPRQVKKSAPGPLTAAA